MSCYCHTQRGFDCYGLTFNYGQRHQAELAAKRLAHHFSIKEHKISLSIWAQ
ncbi:7-cyano-7-deazaguanine synthase [Coxiella-like endosymbiont]|uniref:7-cyano-7-deazaguanine synthase n=1 Tax=Coxiella-like endosymbiont TaxID=1592897 RepID=UPI002729D4CB|nr:7-cyano-7-deazaguanine synthase [Coxiella-like endosymbiont]